MPGATAEWSNICAVTIHVSGSYLFSLSSSAAAGADSAAAAAEAAAVTTTTAAAAAEAEHRRAAAYAAAHAIFPDKRRFRLQDSQRTCHGTQAEQDG